MQLQDVAGLKHPRHSLLESEFDLVRANLFPVHAPVINGETVTFSQHLSRIEAEAQRIKPDIIMIDTASAAYDIQNENDNAEIQSIMKSLIRLARRLNCLLIVIHHIGKAKIEGGLARESAHKGRGASAWADFSTTIFTLEADPKEKDQVILECAKRKDGDKYELILKLNRQARWFTVSDQAVKRPPSNYDLVVEVVKSFDRVVERQEIDKALEGKVAKGTITRCLTKAVERGDITKPKRGSYQYNQAMLMCSSTIETVQ